MFTHGERKTRPNESVFKDKIDWLVEIQWIQHKAASTKKERTNFSAIFSSSYGRATFLSTTMSLGLSSFHIGLFIKEESPDIWQSVHVISRYFHLTEDFIFLSTTSTRNDTYRTLLSFLSLSSHYLSLQLRKFTC